MSDTITLPELIKNMKDKNFRDEIILEEVEKWLARNQLEIEKKDKAVKYSEKVAYETSKTNANLMAEIERLKGLLEKEFKNFRDTDSVERRWQQFKTDNKIEDAAIYTGNSIK